MKLRLAVASASLALSGGVAFGAPPTGFSYDDYTVDAGAITAGCPVGFTCTTLDASGNGILQQRVTDGSDTYFRTIVVPDGVTAADLAAVESLAFRNESYVSAVSGSGDYAARGVVLDQGNLVLGGGGTNPTVTDSMYALTEITGGALNTGDEIVIEQRNVLGANAAGAVTRSAEFVGAGSSNNLAMALNIIQPTNEGNMTIRKVTATAPGNLELTDADAGIAPLAYAAGNRLQVVWLEQAASGTGDAFNRALAQQSYRVYQSGTDNTLLGEISYSNADGAGNFVATNTGANNPVGGIGPWNWNATLFGTEPNPYVVNTGGTGIALPATTFP
ncbi:MAG: hypothetical protein RBT81_06970 [Gammaproteobacteria bacterium]|nr:hypothetical protein [Gammaproteobacteria bacterium]